MSARGDDAEKTSEPTPQRIERARREGDVPRSLDAAAAASYGVVLLFLAVFGADWAQRALAHAAFLLANPETAAGAGLAAWAGEAALMALPLLALPFLATIIAHALQGSFAASSTKLMPRLSQIDPLTQARQRFGPTGLVEFVKATVKMIAIGASLFLILRGDFESIVGAARGTAGGVAAALGHYTIAVVGAVLAIAVPIALLDLVWQRADHRRRLRMSRDELRDEMKETEGDPGMKASRRRRGQEIATNRMLLDVPKADVVIVNPTHYAVALQWSRAPGSAPVCVAKGTDEIALRIRIAAAEHGVPIRSDPPTARAIHATVEIGSEIREDQYRAVAAAIRYADRARRASGRPRR
ncbi:MAG: EscU/YscU/HrcU family type III secretion system export apparatus switch protein [Rubricella sp.]